VRAVASVVVPAPPERVWPVLVRWEDQPRWMRDAAFVRVVGPAREGVGVRLAVRTRVLGVALFTEPLEVTRWEPPRRLVVEHRGAVRGLGTWTLRPEGSGTRFTWAEELRLPPPVIGELVLLAYRPLLRRQMRRSLERLRDAVAEAGG
jgi:uncharacterized protein YndB with AHSA1/START domain